MTKIRVDSDEFYPWYDFRSAGDKFGYELDVEDTVLERWRKVLHEAIEVQDEISEAVRTSRRY